MTTQYYVASSLDGFIADRNNSLDWLLQFGFEQFADGYNTFMSQIGVVIMGADTYEFVLNDPAGWSYDVPAFVLTHRDLPGIDGADIRFTQRGIAELHADAVALAGEKNVWVIGGGNVAAQFAQAELLDELIVTVMPVVLGAGRPLLPVSDARSLTANGVTQYENGAIELRYAVSATIDTAGR